jgi:MoxR-like ATPase
VAKRGGLHQFGEDRRGYAGDTFVGRTGLLADLADIAAKVVAGEPWLVLIEGEPGIGKSALIRRFTAQLTGFRVLDAAAQANEADLPTAVLGQLLSRVDARLRAPYPLRSAVSCLP